MTTTLPTGPDNPITPSQQFKHLKNSAHLVFKIIGYKIDKHINYIIAKDSNSKHSNCWLEPSDFSVPNIITVTYVILPPPPLAQSVVIDLMIDTPTSEVYNV